MVVDEGAVAGAIGGAEWLSRLRVELRERDVERARTGVHHARTQVFPSPRAEARSRRGADLRRGRHRPVFVDDSGKRRRVVRAVGSTLGILAFTYVGFVGLTFAGAPGLGQLDAPGLGQLTNPSGDQADVGADPVEQPVPAAVAPDGDTVQAPADPTPTSAPAEPPTTAATPATTATTAPTTTTVVHGNGGTPNSTVPDKGGGPPTSRPNG